MIAALALLLLASAPPPTASDDDARIYVAKLRAPDVDEPTALAIEDAVLVAAKKARPDLIVIGRSDVSTLIDVVGDQRAAGCDTESCAAEVADALGAPQIMTGQLARVGSTWMLSLTRLERRSLTVVARDSIQGTGDSPEVLIPQVPKVVRGVLGASDVDGADASAGGAPLFIGGGVALGAGAVVGVLGAGMLVIGLDANQKAKEANADGRDADVAALRAYGEPAYYGGLGALVVGAAAIVVGATLIVVGALE